MLTWTYYTPYATHCSKGKNCLQIENCVAKMRLSAVTARKIQDVFISEMNKGIHQQPSSLQMENTYIPELLNGTGY